MLPVLPVVHVPASHMQDYIGALRRHDAAVRRLAEAAVQFLQAAFPQGSHRAADLGAAFVELACGETENQIARVATDHARVSHMNAPTPETLVYLTKERDQIEAQLALLAEATKKFPVEGMVDLYEATVAVPLRDRLASVNEQLSAAQRELESTPPAPELEHAPDFPPSD